MNTGNNSNPSAYESILTDTRQAGFAMASDILTCSLLRTLAAAKRGGKFLELGTGTGLSTSWILDGMDASSSLISIDNDEPHLAIAEKYLASDERLELICVDGTGWIEQNLSQRFDFIFADTWPGKYWQLDEVLGMLNPGGFYIIDDMLPQSNWPEGHAAKVDDLISTLTARTDLFIARQDWASGIIIAVKKI